jgi:FMN reductase
MNILLLAGSPSAPSRSTHLLRHAGEALALRGHRIELLQVRDLPAPSLLHADFSNTDLIVAKAQVEQAQAIVVATPVYKAAYSGILKAFLDILPQDGLFGKLVLPLATGGSQSHMLALDYALRPVLSSLSAKHVLPSIYATDTQVVRNDDGGLSLDPAIAARLKEGIENLSDSLYALHASSTTDFNAVPFSQVRCSV